MARTPKSFSAAAKLAERAQARLKETQDPQKVAQELAAEANMKPAEMVKETPYIKPGDDVPDIGSNQQFEQAIAPLNNPKDVGQQTGIKGGFAIPMLVDKKEPRIPDFEEVKTKVAKALKDQRAKEQLESKAKEIASTVGSADQLKAAAQKPGFEAATEESFKLGKTLGSAGTSPALDEAIYALKAGEVTKTPVKSGDNWVVIGVTRRTEADLAEFAKQREQLTESMVSQRQDQVFADYIAGVQEKMKRDGKIKVYEEVLLSLDTEEPVTAPPPPNPRRFPVPTK